MQLCNYEQQQFGPIELFRARQDLDLSVPNGLGFGPQRRAHAWALGRTRRAGGQEPEPQQLHWQDLVPPWPRHGCRRIHLAKLPRQLYNARGSCIDCVVHSKYSTIVYTGERDSHMSITCSTCIATATYQAAALLMHDGSA